MNSFIIRLHQFNTHKSHYIVLLQGIRAERYGVWLNKILPQPIVYIHYTCMLLYTVIGEYYFSSSLHSALPCSVADLLRCHIGDRPAVCIIECWAESLSRIHTDYHCDSRVRDFTHTSRFYNEHEYHSFGIMLLPLHVFYQFHAVSHRY